MKNIVKLLLLPVISITLFYYTLSSNISPKLGLDLHDDEKEEKNE